MPRRAHQPAISYEKVAILLELHAAGESAIARDASVAQGNLANYKRGRPTLGPEALGRLYARLGIAPPGRLQPGLYSWRVRDELRPLERALEMAGALDSERARFPVTVIMPEWSTQSPDQARSDDGWVYALRSPDWRFRIRITRHIQDKTKTHPSMAPGHLKGITWGSPQYVRVPAPIWAAWQAGAPFSAREFDRVLERKPSWEDLIEQWSAEGRDPGTVRGMVEAARAHALVTPRRWVAVIKELEAAGYTPEDIRTLVRRAGTARPQGRQDE